VATELADLRNQVAAARASVAAKGEDLLAFRRETSVRVDAHATKVAGLTSTNTRLAEQIHDLSSTNRELRAKVAAGEAAHQKLQARVAQLVEAGFDSRVRMEKANAEKTAAEQVAKLTVAMNVENNERREKAFALGKESGDTAQKNSHELARMQIVNANNTQCTMMNGLLHLLGGQGGGANNNTGGVGMGLNNSRNPQQPRVDASGTGFGKKQITMQNEQ
jgi:hypothetical protein